jgi:hypothetical protein
VRSQFEELGEELALGTSVASLRASIESLSGDWERAQQILEFGVEYTRELPPQRPWYAYLLSRLGEAALEVGDPRRAARLAEQARASAVVGDVETEISWRRVAARASAATGHPRNAVHLGREAVGQADSTEDLLLQGEARLDLAEVLFCIRRAPEGTAMARDGLALLDRKGAVRTAANGRLRFGHLLVDEEKGGARTAPPRNRSANSAAGM